MDDESYILVRVETLPHFLVNFYHFVEFAIEEVAVAESTTR